MSPSDYLRPVLEWLEAGAPHETSVGNLTFNMDYFTTYNPGPEEFPNRCGTACCIAGATQQFNNIPITDDISPIIQSYALGKAIGLTRKQSKALFIPEHKLLNHITPEEAAATLRRFIETGKIKW